jgi:uncharacterized protein YggL (DUF469 family)
MTAACPEFGFEITVRLAPHVDARRRRTLAATFRTLAESNGLIADGGGEREWHYVITRDGGQAIDADRALLGDWIRSRPEIAHVDVGPIVDLKEADA